MTAFAAGVVSFLSPCVLPLVPGYVSFVAGRSLADMERDDARLPILGLSLLFVLGFSTVFVALGASASYVGRWLLAYREEASLVAGAIIIVFGLFLTGVFRPLWLQRDWRFNGWLPGGQPVAAYVLGLAFAFGWTPCIGPVLGSILTLSASAGSAERGLALLGVYSLGLGLPFLGVALFTGRFMTQLETLRRYSQLLQRVTGILLIVMGLAILTGRLSALSYWLLETFPALGRIG